MPDAARRVADRLDVREVLNRYAFACDTRDWALLDTCFLPDAQVQYESLPAFPDGYAGLRASTIRILGSLRSTQHLLGNLHVLVHGDRARSTCYVQATHVGDGGQCFVTGGRYDDEFVRTPSGWQIASRVFRGQWRADPDGLGAGLKSTAGSSSPAHEHTS